jgi:hypothetical protein
MSLIKQSDVKSHPSTQSATSVFPFGLKKSDTATASEPNAADTKEDISISPSHPISPEAVPNAQVGGSIGNPVNAAKSGKGSW